MVDTPEFTRWRQAAEEALAGARTQQAAGGRAWAAFLSEQAAQLALKGWLHGVGAGSSVWGHDLVELGKRLADQSARPLAPELALALRRLSRHYIASRYPDAHPAGTPGSHYGAEEVVEALRDTEAVLVEVDRRWAELSA